MFFNSIKEINRLKKYVNMLLSEEMSNIYLKVVIEKKWRTQNFDWFSKFKNFVPRSALMSSNTHRCHSVSTLQVATYKSEDW